MDNFIACFDLLGYESFLQNPTSIIKRGWNSILSYVEISLAKGETKTEGFVAKADLEKINLSCQIISDTILVWTNQPIPEQFREMVRAASEINTNLNRSAFPVRGALVFGDVEIIQGGFRNTQGFEISLYSIIGQSLALAHKKSSDLNLAGCVIDQSVIDALENQWSSLDLLKESATLYRVPYKSHRPENDEYMLDLTNKGLNEEAFKNLQEDLRRAFSSFNKPMTERANELLSNTLKYSTILRS